MGFEALAILGEGGGVEGFVVGLHVKEPSKEEIVVDLLEELAFAANGVKGHEEKGIEEPFGRHTGSAGRAVGLFEERMVEFDDAIGASFEIAERMVVANAVLHFEGMKQRQLLIDMSAHRDLPGRWEEFSAMKLPWQRDFFSSLLAALIL
jgi:hypothetical protein